MALQLNINICQNKCDQFILSEITGQYSLDNTTGYGVLTEPIVGGEIASAEVTLPNGTIISFPTIPGYPSTTLNNELFISPQMLGLSTLEDGVYYFKYKVHFTNRNEYEVTKSIFLICNIECCVTKMLASIEDPACDCSKDKLDEYLKAYALLLALKHSIACGNIKVSQDLIDKLNKICNNSNNCKNCNN